METPADWPLIGGELHTPYFIFLRCAGRYSDADLLALFGLSDYRRSEAAPRLHRYAIVADDGRWTLLADDWYYTLWHMPTTRPTLEALGKVCDVFACSVGDCDESFDFVYYRDSRLDRKHVVASPHFMDRIVVEDIGEPLPGEASAFAEADALYTVLGIAASLGIRTRYTEDEIRVYAAPEEGRRRR